MISGPGDAPGGLGLLRQLFGNRPAARPAPSPAIPDDPIAEATLLALQHHAIRPTPEAYTLWYRHLAGERPDLSRRLKDLEARGERFDAVLIAELFERYCGIEGEVTAVAEAGLAIEQLLSALAADMAAVGADAATRGERLERLGADLEPGVGDAPPGEPATGAAKTARAIPPPVRRAIASLVEEIRAMRTAAHRLQRRVVESAGEIAQLRATVEAAGMAAECCPVTGVGTTRVLQRAMRRVLRDADGTAKGGRNGAEPAGGAAPPGHGCCFLIADLDGFAAFNKAHGRRLGDLVLKTTARHLAMAIKRGDTIGRLEGAAFGIVLARTDLGGGEALAERLRQIASEQQLDLGGMPAELASAELTPAVAVPPVTLSIGIAAYHPGEPWARLIGRADRARQLAKDSGGNRVVSERATAVVGRPKA